MMSFYPKILSKWLPTCLIVLGLGLRVMFPGTYSFGFDQVQILSNAQQIITGHLTLIGPRTGPADMFTGPLIYYLTASILLLTHASPWSLVIVANLLALVTSLSLYYLASKAFNRTNALLLLAIWAVSPYLVSLDRIVWNPNLTLISALFIYFSLYLMAIKKNYVISISLIFLGSLLGYQAHFSGLILIPMALVFFIPLKQYKLLPLLALFGGTAISLLPTLLFDLRHDWLNVRGLQTLLSTSTNHGGIIFFEEIYKTTQITIENIGKIFWWHSNEWLILVSGLGFVVLFIVYIGKTKHYSVHQIMPLLWLGITILSLSLYSKNKPEYYFLIQIPAIIHMLVVVISHYQTISEKKLLLSFYLVYALLLSVDFHRTSGGMSLGSQLQVVKYIQTLQPPPNLAIDIKPEDRYGLDFLLTTIQRSASGDPKSTHITYPNQTTYSFTKHFGPIGVWTDPRSLQEKNYYTTNEYIIGVEKPYTLSLEDETVKYYDHDQVYSIAKQNQIIARLSVLQKKLISGDLENDLITTCLNNRSNQLIICEPDYILVIHPLLKSEVRLESIPVIEIIH